jgi:hypothetical protein
LAAVICATVRFIGDLVYCLLTNEEEEVSDPGGFPRKVFEE